jgi:hypothetical protein
MSVDLGVSYVINAPRSLSVVWGMAVKILPQATIDKIHILGADYQDALLANITKDNLSVDYGGTRTDKFPGAPRLEAILGPSAVEKAPEARPAIPKRPSILSRRPFSSLRNLVGGS